MNGIAYRGTGPAMNDLLSGQFDIMCDQTTNTTNHINAGKIKGYAVTSEIQGCVGSAVADPQIAKAIPVFRCYRHGTPCGRRRVCPKDIADKFVAALQTALKDQKVAERFASLGTEPVAPPLANPDALKSHLAAEVKRWDAVIKAAGVKGELGNSYRDRIDVAGYGGAFVIAVENWSGRRDSNPRPRPWQGRALPLSYTRVRWICDRAMSAAKAVPIAKREGPMQPWQRGRKFSTGRLAFDAHDRRGGADPARV